MKKILAALALAGGLLAQQQNVLIQAPSPQPVQGLGSAVSGTPGTTLACYWVVINYVGGGVLSAAPTCLSNVPNTLSGSNYVQLNWQAATGSGITYDVLKTTSTTPPTPGASDGLTTGLTVTSYQDTGGSLSPYTIAAYPYSSGTCQITANNRDYTVPAVQINGSIPFPCQDAVDVVQPKPANGVVRLCVPGSAVDCFTVDKTGAAFITQGPATPGGPVGTVISGLTQSVSATLTLAQVNTGALLVPAVTGQTFKISHVFLQATGGSTAACTSVDIEDTAGTPLVAFAATAASLTSGTVVTEATASGVTLTKWAPLTLTTSQGIQIVHVGSACTTATGFNVIIYFTVNS